MAYDQGTNRVLVDTSSPLTQRESAAPAPSGVVTIPVGRAPPAEGSRTKVLCDDGTTYEITDLRHLCAERGADVLALAGRPAYPSILPCAGGPGSRWKAWDVCTIYREIYLY